MRIVVSALLLGLGLLSGCVIPLDPPPKQEKPAATAPKDPVCGVTCLDDKCEREQWRHQEYSFCSKKCRDTFLEDPGRYSSRP